MIKLGTDVYFLKENRLESARVIRVELKEAEGGEIEVITLDNRMILERDMAFESLGEILTHLKKDYEVRYRGRQDAA